MRRTMSILLATTVVVAGAVAGPAVAKKKKTVTEEWSAQNPVPLFTSFLGSGEGCQEGQETLTKTTHSFTPPGTGTLEVVLSEFEGDWDLYVFDEGGNVLGQSDAGQVISMAPPGEKIEGVKLKKGQAVDIVACNWMGGPTAEGSLAFTY